MDEEHDIAPITVNAVVEGLMDESIVRRLIDQVGLQPGIIQSRGGKQQVLKQLSNYNQAAKYSAWVVLIDHD
jgi:hypothetical protein